jgi:hypothetical protein
VSPSPAPVSPWPRTAAPAETSKRPSSQLTAPTWHVTHVVLTTGQDVSTLLNHWGDVYHVWPIGLAATLGVESGLNPFAERWAGGLDNSCGLAQQIVTNVAYYQGIDDARAACNWEEVPSNSIQLEARMYADFFRIRSCIDWPLAYELWNAGPGWSCAYYVNPAADVYAHEQNFLGWYSYALQKWQAPPPPPRPRPFPLKLWQTYWRAHKGHVAQLWPWIRVGTTCVRPCLKRYRLIFAASLWRSHGPRRAGGIIAPEHYFKKLHVMKDTFQLQTLYWWPRRPQWQPRWITHRRRF